MSGAYEQGSTGERHVDVGKGGAVRWALFTLLLLYVVNSVCTRYMLAPFLYTVCIVNGANNHIVCNIRVYKWHLTQAIYKLVEKY